MKGIDTDRLKLLVRSVKPEFGAVELQVLGEGFHSSVYTLNGTMVLRVANTAEAASAYYREEKFLPLIKSCLSVSIPEPVTYDVEGTVFAIHPLIEGATYTEICEKRNGAPEQVIDDLARCFSGLHQCDGLNGATGIREISFVDSVNSNAIFAAAEFLGDLPKVKQEYERFLKLAETCEQKPKVLVHGDANHANILVKTDNSGLAGMIDFSELSYQIPEHDFTPLIKSDPVSTMKIIDRYTSLTSHKINVNYVVLCAKMRAYDGLAAYIGTSDEKKIRHFKKRLAVLEYF